MGVVVNNLYPVGDRWKFRKVIPERVRAHINGNITEYVRWYPLKGVPRSNPELHRWYAERVDEVDALLAVAEKRRTGTRDELTPAIIQQIVETARSSELEQDNEARFSGEDDAVFESVRSQLKTAGVTTSINSDPDRMWAKRQESLETFLAQLRFSLARGRIGERLKWELCDLCHSHGLLIDEGSPGYGHLIRSYLAMMIEVTEAKLRRQEGYVVPTPEPPAAPSQPTDAPSAEAGLSLRELASKKLAMEGKGYSTQEATETALRLFESCYRPEAAMASISRRQVSDWIELLQRKPTLPAKEDRGLPLPALVAKYDGREVKRLSGKSINGHVSHLHSVWTWARKRGYVDRALDNPFSDQRVHQVTPVPGEGFTTDQLRAIFALPVFTSGERPQGGRGEAAFWIPLLLLTYGTRPEEVCQLLVSDVFHDPQDHQWCLRITDEGDHPVKGSRNIKTEGNPLVRRSLPVTKSLIALGFLEYVDSLRRAGTLALFPELTTKGKRGYLHSGFADWWGGYLRMHGAIPETGNKPLRDFRGTWTTAASRAGLSEEEREWIQGHYRAKASSSNRKYGVRDFGSKIEAVEFKGLDLTKLRAPRYSP